MEYITQLAVPLIFLSVVALHIAKTNTTSAYLYAAQSACVAAMLLVSALIHPSVPIFLVVLAVFTLKVIVAPRFFLKLIKNNEMVFSGSTHLNTPLTLVILAALTGVAHGKILTPLTALGVGNPALTSLAFAVILISFFLVINRKGALSQMLGILSMENGIVAFAMLAGLEQSSGLQAGIMFDLFIWLMIATTFISMMYTHFGSLDATAMKSLHD